MELTKENIQQIKDYLKTLKFDYQDLNLEILDHIAAEIEEQMQKNNLDFKTAFALTRIKWHRNFRKISSFYFGHFYAAPKIVIEKAKKIYRPFYFGLFFSYFIPLILVNQIFSENFLKNNLIKTSLFIIAWASTIISLIIISKILFSEIKTVYRFIVKTNFFTVIILFLIIPLFFILNIAQNITIPLSLTSVYIGIVLFYFYTKHFTTNNISKTNKIATQKIHKTHR